MLISLPGLLSAQHTEKKAAMPVNLFPFFEKDKWGYINHQGKVVIQPRFIQARDFENGLSRVQTEKNLGFINDQGKVVFATSIDKPTDWTGNFSDGRAAFSVKKKCGYFDAQGNVVIDPKYDDAEDFSDGLAAVNEGAKPAAFPRPYLEGGKWGFINKTGRRVIPMHFDRVSGKGFSGGVAIVKFGDIFQCIDKAGKVLFKLESKIDGPRRKVLGANGFSEGLAAVEIMLDDKDIRKGFIDKTGKLAIEPRFDDAQDFSQGLAAVALGKKWGYVDESGQVVIEPQFNGAKAFSEGLAGVRKGERWSFIDKKGKAVIAGEFNDVERHKGGLARVHEGGSFVRTEDGPGFWSGGAWFYIDKQGRKIHRCRPDGVKGAPKYGKEYE